MARVHLGTPLIGESRQKGAKMPRLSSRRTIDALVVGRFNTSCSVFRAELSLIDSLTCCVLPVKKRARLLVARNGA